MHKPLLAVTLALALLPTASASTPEEPTAYALGHVQAGGFIEITLATDNQAQGDLLPACEGSPPVEEGAIVAGTTYATCFQILHIDTADHGPSILRAWTTSAHVVIVGGANPGPTCDPVGVSVLPQGGPPIVMDPDEACIAGIIHELLE